jgi:hypothetical protein
MSNPNHDEQGKFSSGPGAGADRATMTQVHQFRTRGNVRLKPAAKRALASGGGSSGGQGGGAIQQVGHKPRRLTSAAQERRQLNQDLDRRGNSGGGGRAMAEAGSEIRRALKRR